MVWTVKPPLGTQLDWTNPLNQGLVGFWLFNEGMGDKVNDLSGNANTGTLINMAFPSIPTSGWNPGRLGPAIIFDGSDDYIQVEDSSSLSFPSGGMSISAWIRLNTAPPLLGSVIVGKYQSPYEYVIGVQTDGDLTIYIYDQSTASYIGREANNIMTDTNYHHVVATYNGGVSDVDIGIYLDGIKVDNLSDSFGVFSKMGDTTSPLRMGNANGWGATNYFGGTIDEVRIWNRPLLLTEVQKLYTQPYSMFLDVCPTLKCLISII